MRTDDPSTLFTSDNHPDEDLLFLAIERELSPEETAQIEEHLGACWQCRVRSEEMQNGILAFMEYREKRFAPMLTPPPNGYRNFAGRLQTVSQETVARKSLLGWLSALRDRLSHFLFPGRLKWASVVAIAMVIVLLYVQVINPPSLSAEQLLTRAQAAQDFGSDKPGRSRIVRQAVQITIGGQTTVKTFTWTTGRTNPLAHWGSQTVWNAPLTASGFAEWRRSLDAKTDRVKRSGGLWLLDTVAPHDAVREAWLTVRAADFHPIEERLRFQDDHEVTIKELSFDTQEQALLAPESVSKQDSPAPARATAQVTGNPTPQSAAVDLDETELQVRYQLFKDQGDLGEELTISQSGGNVVLSGTVSSQEREAALRAALGVLQHVRVETNPPIVKSLAVPSPRPSTPTLALGTAPLLESAIAGKFASKEDQSAFVEESLAASEAAISHAWALKRLADRYDDSETRKLSQDSRRKLAEMLQGHLKQIHQSHAKLDRLLALLPQDTGSVKATAPNWRDGVFALFAQVDKQDHAVTALLASTPRKAQDLSAITADFQSSHRIVGLLLRSLDNIKLDQVERDK